LTGFDFNAILHCPVFSGQDYMVWFNSIFLLFGFIMISYGFRVLWRRRKSAPVIPVSGSGLQSPAIPATEREPQSVRQNTAMVIVHITRLPLLKVLKKKKWWKMAPKEEAIRWMHSLHPVSRKDDFSGDILRTTLLIHQTHPELSKYLEEMTVTLPDVNNPVISNQVLMEYSETLHTLLNSYSKNRR
jgi:hypothetical protein